MKTTTEVRLSMMNSDTFRIEVFIDGTFIACGVDGVLSVAERELRDKLKERGLSYIIPLVDEAVARRL
jgi:hypothetical protein